MIKLELNISARRSAATARRTGGRPFVSERGEEQVRLPPKRVPRPGAPDPAAVRRPGDSRPNTSEVSWPRTSPERPQPRVRSKSQRPVF